MTDDAFYMVRDKKTGKFYTSGGSVWLIGTEPPPRIYLPMICTRQAAEMYAREIGNAEVVRQPAEDQVHRYPLYSQRDPLWKDDRMNNTASLIEYFGCLITSVAMMLVHATGDDSITPKVVNQRLTANGGYVTGSASLIFAKVAELWPVVKLGAIWDYPYPKNADTVAINGKITAGQYALIKVDFDPSTSRTDEHWVLCVGIDEDNTYFIHDPWTGKKHDMPPAYAKAGWSPAATIFRVAFYEKAG